LERRKALAALQASPSKSLDLLGALATDATAGTDTSEFSSDCLVGAIVIYGCRETHDSVKMLVGPISSSRNEVFAAITSAYKTSVTRSEFPGLLRDGLTRADIPDELRRLFDCVISEIEHRERTRAGRTNP
jgi:hypothetical protein